MMMSRLGMIKRPDEQAPRQSGNLKEEVWSKEAQAQMEAGPLGNWCRVGPSTVKNCPNASVRVREDAQFLSSAERSYATSASSSQRRNRRVIAMTRDSSAAGRAALPSVDRQALGVGVWLHRTRPHQPLGRTENESQRWHGGAPNSCMG